MKLTFGNVTVYISSRESPRGRGEKTKRKRRRKNCKTALSFESGWEKVSLWLRGKEENNKKKERKEKRRKGVNPLQSNLENLQKLKLKLVAKGESSKARRISCYQAPAIKKKEEEEEEEGCERMKIGNGRRVNR